MDYQSMVYVQYNEAQTIQFSQERLQVCQKKGKSKATLSGALLSKKRMLTERKWTVKERIKYFWYLQDNYQLFGEDCAMLERFSRNFMMADFIKSKNYIDCRRFHNTMIAKYRKVQKVIAHFSRYFTCARESQEKLEDYRGLNVQLDSEERLINSYQHIQTEEKANFTYTDTEINFL